MGALWEEGLSGPKELWELSRVGKGGGGWRAMGALWEERLSGPEGL